MSVILWIIFGALTGWIASMITGDNARMGGVANIIVGILGALVGGLVMGLLGFGGAVEFSLGGLAVAVGGAVLLLWIINSFFAGTRSIRG